MVSKLPKMKEPDFKPNLRKPKPNLLLYAMVPTRAGRDLRPSLEGPGKGEPPMTVLPGGRN